MPVFQIKIGEERREESVVGCPHKPQNCPFLQKRFTDIWGQFHQRVYVQLLSKQIPKAQKTA